MTLLRTGSSAMTLSATGSSFTSGILINISMCCILSQINVCILYILIKKP
jgi:hypothetical protein